MFAKCSTEYSCPMKRVQDYLKRLDRDKLIHAYFEHAPKTGETQEGRNEDEENYYNAIEILSQANKDDENEEQCEEEQLKRLSAWMVAYKAERDYDKYCFEKELKALKQSLQ